MNGIKPFAGKLAAGATLLSVLCGAAIAAPVNFMWTPSAATPSLNGGAIVNANNYNVADFTSTSVNTSTGTFTETGALNILNFLNGGSTVTSTGLGVAGGYSLYLVFTGTGTLNGIPSTPGTSTDGTFTSLSYQLIGSTNPVPVFTVSNGSVAITDGGAHANLAFGSLVPGTGFTTLTRTANGFSPTANLNMTFNECLAAGQGGGFCTANESVFFTAPTLPNLSLQIGNFSATDSVTALNSVGSTAFINVNGGGGNLTFNDPVRAPEPASLAVIGSGLLSLLGVRPRRAKSRAS